MYSSIDKPTLDDWIRESNKLLKELEENLSYYKSKIEEHQKSEDDFMLRYYCIKLLDANKRLEIGQVTLS